MVDVTAAIAGVFGALIGSFLNVVVYRVPKGLSIVSPPSACPSCGAGIRGMDNVPLISWLVLRGRCRDCATRISARYPLVELGTALLFAASSAVFLPAVAVAFESGDTGQVAGTIVVTIAFLYFASISVALALIDVDTHRLPNSIVLPSYLVASVLLTTAALAFGDFSTLGRSFTGMAALFVFYLALALLKPGGMG
ncbi:prepilin peptidase, partial [Cryobacterium sp. 10I5]